MELNYMGIYMSEVEMNNLMSWGSCKREFIRKVEVDLDRVESIRKTALLRLSRARGTKVDGENVSLIVEDYYEVIKELLVAYLLKSGMRSKNHQCLISYFTKENPDLEKESILISQMSFFRNRLGYYGEMIPVKFYKEKKEDFERLVSILFELIK